MREILTRMDFDQAIAAGETIVITDSGKTRIHRPLCPSVRASYFETKVVLGGGKTGAYFAFPTREAAIQAHGDLTCSRCAGKAPRSPLPTGQLDGNFIVEATSGMVEAWSAKRLNFTPKDWRASFREEIRAAVSKISTGQGQRLHAEYISPERGDFDLENILFFNIDEQGQPFGGSAGRAVRFERGFGQAPPARDGTPFNHYHLYEIEDLSAEPRLWAFGPPLARWERQPCTSPDKWKRAAHTWKWMKAAEIGFLESPSRVPEEFALRVVLHGPGGELNLLKVVKPLFDGIISALQADNGRSPSEGVRLHAQIAGLSVEAATAMLSDSSRAILGSTKLLTSKGQMQPSDHLCVLGELARDTSVGTSWECSGEVVRVTRLS